MQSLIFSKQSKPFLRRCTISHVFDISYVLIWYSLFFQIDQLSTCLGCINYFAAYDYLLSTSVLRPEYKENTKL